MALNNFTWIIPGLLAGSGIPGNGIDNIEEIENDLRMLSSYGVHYVLSLCDTNSAVKDICTKLDMKWENFPIQDFSIPINNDEFDLLIDDIVSNMKNQICVCVHCQAGIGRTGLVLSCIVGRFLALNGKKAMAVVRNTREAVETYEQENFVMNFLGEYEY